ATNDIYFSGEGMYEAHDALMCIADGKYVMDGERRRLTPEHRFKTTQEMCALFADVPEAIENTLVIAKRCAVMSPARKPILPRFTDETGANEEELLRKYAREGLETRLADHVFTHSMNEDEKKHIAQPYRERL